MAGGKFSPAWHQDDASTFAKIFGGAGGSRGGRVVDHEDPVHQERLARYEVNVLYYGQQQYADENRRHIQARDFSNLRLNFSSIIPKGINKKATWLFGKPLGINAIGLDNEGNPVDKPSDEQQATIKRVKDKINQVRKHNGSELWDWIEAVMGQTCGDFFVKVDAEEGDELPEITLYDPSYVFPDYPDDFTKPMRACQIQYEVDRKTKKADTDGSDDTLRIVEDYRLELKNRPLRGTDDPDDMPYLADEDLAGLTAERIGDVEGRPEALDEIICVYRYYEGGVEDPEKRREIGIPAIPIVHGTNLMLWQARFGVDEVSTLIPKLEYYNEQFLYAGRIGRHNSHAKLALKGVRKGDGALESDYDDVIYLGENGAAEVLTLPSDPAMLKFVTDKLDVEMHNDANIPFIADQATSAEFGSAPSGLALKIQYGPLEEVTNLHRLTYGYAKNAVYTLVLLFDEMVIQSQSYGSIYKYKTWDFKFDWPDMTPQAEDEIMQRWTTASADGMDGTGPLVSKKTAREKIPGIDPDLEERRVKEQVAQGAQLSPNSSSLGTVNYTDLLNANGN